VEFALRGVDGKGMEGGMIYGDPSIFHKTDYVRVDIPLSVGS
jgi:hypothetical protein